ncbi:PTS sugar transporter subunit IIA [Merdibacter massiliensis]|uniref:PTS sugar transporter subunit IIA n=1 Tax=Merdibacter massiliensis TaxID=1871030 RepID=UPI00096AA613|nr:PTS sugar transporter subunit IIA [Merdibacter massiliensis]
MLGIVIATHGTFSNGLKDAAEVIMGETNNIATVNLLAGEDVQKLSGKITEAISKVNQGDGVIVLTDLISASPYNQSLIATSSLENTLKNDVYVIGGVNLPVLLEAINAQILNTPIHELASAAVEQGKQNIDLWHAADDTEEEDDF